MKKMAAASRSQPIGCRGCLRATTAPIAPQPRMSGTPLSPLVHPLCARWASGTDTTTSASATSPSAVAVPGEASRKRRPEASEVSTRCASTATSVNLDRTPFRERYEHRASLGWTGRGASEHDRGRRARPGVQEGAARRRRHRPAGRARRDLRLPRPERRRQVDDGADAGDAAAADRRHRARGGLRRRQGRPERARDDRRGAAGGRARPAADRPRAPAAAGGAAGAAARGRGSRGPTSCSSASG